MNAPRRHGISFRPDPRARAKRTVTSLSRAAAASARAVFAQHGGNDPAKIAARTWPDDDLAGYIAKAATAPATLGSVLATSVVADLLAAISEASAGAALLSRCLGLRFDHAAQISLPVLVADAGHAEFVAPGAPIPAIGLSIETPPVLEPYKLASIWSLTREQAEGSNAVALVNDCLRRSVGLSLDAILFDDVEGDDVRPSGLRHGVAASTASANPDLNEAMIEDIGTLVSTVAVVGTDVILVMSPARAAVMNLRARGATLPTMLGSASIAAGDVLAISTAGIACAVDAAPTIESSRAALIHHEDTTPLAIGSAGTPNTVAAPSISMWQTDSVAQRLLLPCTWVSRASRSVAWLQSVSW